MRKILATTLLLLFVNSVFANEEADKNYFYIECNLINYDTGKEEMGVVELTGEDHPRKDSRRWSLSHESDILTLDELKVSVGIHFGNAFATMKVSINDIITGESVLTTWAPLINRSLGKGLHWVGESHIETLKYGMSCYSQEEFFDKHNMQYKPSW